MTNDVANKVMVCGFLFFDEGRRILLVRKTHPDWQAGRWNGIGGVVEEDETPFAAMMREFREETGLWINWTMFLVEHEPFNSVVLFFKARIPVGASLPSVPTVNDTGEELCWLDTSRALSSEYIIGNLKWIIPLALDWRELEPVQVRAREDIRKMPSW